MIKRYNIKAYIDDPDDWGAANWEPVEDRHGEFVRWEDVKDLLGQPFYVVPSPSSGESISIATPF